MPVESRFLIVLRDHDPTADRSPSLDVMQEQLGSMIRFPAKADTSLYMALASSAPNAAAGIFSTERMSGHSVPPLRVSVGSPSQSRDQCARIVSLSSALPAKPLRSRCITRYDMSLEVKSFIVISSRKFVAKMSHKWSSSASASRNSVWRQRGEARRTCVEERHDHREAGVLHFES
jgi:hypothetical protein